MRMIAAGILATAALLTGCSGMRIVDTDVNAYAVATQQPVVLPANYRYERLPSQQTMPFAQSRAALEALADIELARVGMRRDDSAPHYSVQLDLRSFRDPQAPWDDPRYAAGFFRPFPVMTRYGVVMHYPPTLNLHFEAPYYRREISLVLRRITDGQVVFETRARHDGRWPDDDGVLPAMLQAALRGFPNPPQGPQRVVIEIPR